MYYTQSRGWGRQHYSKTLILILLINVALEKVLGFPGSLQCKRSKFNPWIRKMPWRRKRQPTPVFLPGKIPWTEEPGGLQSMASQGVGWNWATEHTHTQSHISYSKMDVKMAWRKFNEERIIYFVLKYLPTDDLSHSKGQTGKKVKSTSPNMETKWHYMPSIPHVPSKI